MDPSQDDVAEVIKDDLWYDPHKYTTFCNV